MVMYLYTLTFNIFLTEVFRVPAPLIFCIPLVFVFGDPINKPFKYKSEIIVFFLANLLYVLIGLQSITSFFSILITICCCSLFFNYFIGNDRKKFNLSVWIFYLLLALSAVVLLLDHKYNVISIRSFLVGQTAVQSPSGIAVMIFTYGYQLAAFTAFIAIISATYKNSLLMHLFSVSLCLILILYGMQRSSLIAFMSSLMLFWIFYYRYRAVLIIALVLIASVFLNSYIHELSTGKQQNIFSKNEKSKSAGENRAGFVTENFKIISDYPFGLIISGRTWNDVVKRNPVYRNTPTIVSSHNAYLMFITYLGIVPGLVFLFLIYRKIVKISWFALKYIRDKNNALLVGLCFSFLSVSLNSFFHNEWLLGASGPTLFLYFSILHLYSLQTKKEEIKLVSVSHNNSYSLAN